MAAMPSTLPANLIGVLAGMVVTAAGVGAYLQSSLGGPGTTAFIIRLLLVFLAGIGALLLVLALRTTLGGTDAAHPTPAPPRRGER
jgi:hypothetical protein